MFKSSQISCSVSALLAPLCRTVSSLPRATLTLSLANALEAVQRKRSQLQLGSNFTWGIYADLPSPAPLPHPLPAHLLLLLVSLLLSLCPFTSVLCVCRAGLIKVSQPQPASCRNYCHSWKKKEKKERKDGKQKQNKARSDAWARGAQAVAKLFTIRNCRPFWYWINMLNAQTAQLAHCTSCRHWGCLFSPASSVPSAPAECNCTIPSIVHKMLAQNAA